MMMPSTAALNGDLGALIIAHRRSPALNMLTTLNAARSGSLDCLMFVHVNGAPWHPRTTTAAALGRLHCLEYAHQHGAPWHSSAMANAACGHLDCLRYCHENGAQWTRHVTLNAAMVADVPCLRYAVEHGAPLHHLVIETCVRNTISNPDSRSCRDTLMYAVDARFHYDVTPDAHRTRFVEHDWYHPEPDVTKAAEVEVVVAFRLALHMIRVIQRAWRARPALIRARLALMTKKRKAVEVIELAYLTWTCRPDSGAAFKRSRTSFTRLHGSGLIDRE